MPDAAPISDVTEEEVADEDELIRPSVNVLEADTPRSLETAVMEVTAPVAASRTTVPAADVVLVMVPAAKLVEMSDLLAEALLAETFPSDAFPEAILPIEICALCDCAADDAGDITEAARLAAPMSDALAIR